MIQLDMRESKAIKDSLGNKLSTSNKYSYQLFISPSPCTFLFQFQIHKSKELRYKSHEKKERALPHCPPHLVPPVSPSIPINRVRSFSFTLYLAFTFIIFLLQLIHSNAWSIFIQRLRGRELRRHNHTISLYHQNILVNSKYRTKHSGHKVFYALNRLIKL